MSDCFGCFLGFVPPAKFVVFDKILINPKDRFKPIFFLCKKNDFVKHFS